MNALFGFQIAIGVISGSGECYTFNAGFITGLEVDQNEFEPFTLQPARVHAKQHFGPVLGFSTAGAGIDGNDGITGIVGIVEN